MSLCFVFSRTKVLQTTGKEKETGRYLHKSLPLGKAKRACLCARLLAIFSTHRRTALFTICFSSMCFVFTAKLGGRTAKGARLCTFPHGSAGLCTFTFTPMPSFLHAFSRKWTSSFRIPRNPFKARRIHPELPILHLSAHVRRKTG